MESIKLAEQAMNNTKEHFASSFDRKQSVHAAMSKHSLDFEKLREDLKDVLIGPEQLWESLREKAGGASPLVAPS
jgi:type I restriction enzyme R subunit